MDLFELCTDSHSMQVIVATLQTIRAGVIRDETTELHQAIERSLNAAGIAYDREYLLGPRSRIDFFLSGGIGIEAKRGKPNRKSVIRQLERYSAYMKITGLILVSETSIDLPPVLFGKPLVVVNLQKLWGLAL